MQKGEGDDEVEKQKNEIKTEQVRTKSISIMMDIAGGDDGGNMKENPKFLQRTQTP